MRVFSVGIFGFLVCFLISTTSVAQITKVQKAKTAAKHSYNELDVAKESIDFAIKNEKTMFDSKTWMIRGDIYLKISVSDNDKFKKLAEHPIDDSYFSYQKAYKLDRKSKYKNKIFAQLNTIKDLYQNEGIMRIENKQYSRSYQCFKSDLEISELIDEKKIDTIIFYNLGLVAELNKDYKSAVDYYNQCIEYKYGGPKVFNYIAQIKKQKGDTASYLSYLKQGINNYPRRNDTLLLNLINFYIENDNNYEAIEFLSKAILKDPANQTFYFAQGALYDKMGDFGNAIAAYEKAIVIDSGYFDAYFNIGALYFNKGANLLKSANNIPPNKQDKYEEKIRISYIEFKKAIPYLEKAHVCNPTEESTIITLKDIYLKLRNEDDEYMKKYKEYSEKINYMNSNEK
ncbi:MAG: tetratricopeptide repeat protein [Salinivirgaceae bacterium]|jgi:tetratricopeptide (TPR) repeat protein|nr:tetratricopeptide repeat protein [Salinivirgaceae bacterium]